jgi:hypothetical protein
MLHLITTVHLFLLRLHDDWATPPERDERGSVTIETVAWAAAIIGIVAIAVAAISAYVRSQIGRL